VPFIVTGISQDGDSTTIVAALTAAGLSLEAFDVLGPDDSQASVGVATVDTSILTGGGLETGTGVPGLTSGGIPGITSGPRIVGGSGADSIWDKLADLAIPDDEVENYAEALEMGRSIFAYHGTVGNLAAVEAVFRASGLNKIKTF
jgi:hypothetical protein